MDMEDGLLLVGDLEFQEYYEKCSGSLERQLGDQLKLTELVVLQQMLI
ncbi:hypothetical protein [Bacillus safensis]